MYKIYNFCSEKKAFLRFVSQMHCKHQQKVWEKEKKIIRGNSDAEDSLRLASGGERKCSPRQASHGSRYIKCELVCVLERLRNTSRVKTINSSANLEH